MIPAAGVKFVVSDKRSVPPCGVMTTFQQYRYNVLVQPDCTPTPIEVVDKHGEYITINVNLHPDADIRRDL
eukprot:6785898-Karenia_brevis.AAC.1